MTPDDFERWGKHLPGLLRKDFGLYVDVRNAAADEIERLHARIAELEYKRDRALEEYERAMHRVSELEADRDRLQRSLLKIGQQPLPNEMTDHALPDYEGGYECCVREARGALARTDTEDE